MKTNLRLVPYIPKQFYPRYRDLENMAYNLRHGQTRYKTRVKMGISDLVLYKRRSSDHSRRVHNTDLFSTSPNLQSQSTNNVHLNLRPNSGVSSDSKKQE